MCNSIATSILGLDNGTFFQVNLCIVSIDSVKKKNSSIVNLICRVSTMRVSYIRIDCIFFGSAVLVWPNYYFSVKHYINHSQGNFQVRKYYFLVINFYCASSIISNKCYKSSSNSLCLKYNSDLYKLKINLEQYISSSHYI